MGMKALMPIDEVERLAELRDFRIIGTSQHDDRFSLFTKMASWVFDAPMSAINLVGSETTFFKSLVGLPMHVPERGLAPCGHAISLGNPVMVVPDLAKDERFHDHPLVLEAGIHFYAGALLRSQRTGHALGVLCIGDTEPRMFGSAECAKLADLARGVGSVLELHRTGMELLAAATTDPLTELRNRRGFTDALDGRARAGEPFALFSLDLDGFKPVNDRFGHAAGDEVLRTVADRLRSLTDQTDLIARVGGDEIVVLRSGDLSNLEIDRFATSIQTALGQPIKTAKATVQISVSTGIARWPLDAVSADDLLHRVDHALYEAKRSGPGHHRYAGECRER